MWSKHDLRSENLLEEISKNSSFLNQLAPADALKRLNECRIEDPAR
jgi:hypothetical protein